MTSIYNSDYSLDTLPELILLDTISNLELKDIANVSQVNKRFYSLCQENSLWKIVAEKIGLNFVVTENNKVRNQVRNYILNLKPEIKDLGEPLAEDIAAIVNSKTIPSHEDIQLLKDYRKARDTLVVWQKLANIIWQEAPSSNFKTSDKLFNQAQGFNTWFTNYQTRLTQLDVLVLKNKLSSLPPEIGQLSQLQVLDLSWNNFSTLPLEIGQLTQLQKLNLSFNKLSSLPPEIGQLSQLQELDLYYNKVSSLPPEIGQLSQLQNLNLSFNKVSSLPPEIGQLTQLQNLNLSINNFSTLPPEITQLRSLSILKLDHNKISEIPKTIIPFLIQLGNHPNLSFNRFSDFPSQIWNLIDDINKSSFRDNPLSLKTRIQYREKIYFQEIATIKKVARFAICVGAVAGLGFLAYHYPNEILSGLTNGLPYVAAIGTAVAIQKLVHRYF